MPVCIEKLSGRAFLAFGEMKNLLEKELATRFDYGKIQNSPTISNFSFSTKDALWYGDLLYCPNFNESENPYWARTVMLEPMLINFESIGEAAKSLKEIQRNWAPYQYQFFRRGALIQEKLPYINLKEKNFIKDGKFSLEIPHTPMGLYTLIEQNRMIVSAVTTNSIPAGSIKFVEDHENPPSRAYLKIQEALTLFHHFFDGDLPNQNSICFEAGACPGGWTWVLRQLGAQVFAVDRAPLAPSLMSDSKVTFLTHDAFTLKPQEVCERMGVQKMDWVLSDVICYPKRLFEWVSLWLKTSLAKNMICTIKMQGEIDWNLVRKFAQIPNSRVIHLNYNKHELTWIHAENPTQE